MKTMSSRFVAPILVIVFGVAWLLNVNRVVPAIDWIWTAGLAAVGVITILVGGFNKVSLLVGPFLMVASCCALLRQLGRLTLNLEVPILTITLGILMLVVQLLNLPAPEMLKDGEGDRPR